MSDATSELPPGGEAPRIDDRWPEALSDPHSDIFFAAVSTTRMPMIVTDPRQDDNPIVFANPAFLQMTGYTPDELIGRNCRLLQGPETDPDTIAEVRRAIEERREVSVELLNYKKNGGSFWNALFVSPVYDKDGELVYFFASQLDISRRRDAEDALRQAQKMEAVGQLTGGIAHDFNNLLQVIVGFVDIARNQLKTGQPNPAKVDRAIGAIGQAAERGASLTQQLLSFARKQRLQGRIVNLNEMVEQMQPLFERTAGASIAVEPRLHPGPCTTKIDPVQAELALMNVLINARDAMPGGGKLLIETDLLTVLPEDRAAFGELQPGPYVTLSVTDTGEGIPPEILARVMEPFFTTKEQGKGTGLGLSMVYGFLKQSGGAARIYSEEGVGTTVRLYFPAVDGAAEPQGARTSRAADERIGSETVLVVEDQSDVGDLAEAILEEFGYTVLRASSGPQALEVLDGAARIDLLFTDLIMPGGMNGVTLAREARRRQPRLKVLLTTGYAEASIERVDAGGTEFEVINKPYRRSELARRVRQVLDGPTGVG